MHNPPSAPKDSPNGAAYWRSLEEYADSPAFREQLEQEFPGYDPEQLVAMSRRGFLKLGGAAMALAGLTLTGCRRWPAEQLAPYANRPDGVVPGVPDFYATMSERGGVATGLLAESFDGRPIKIEGNPEHPFSLGATDAWQQASVLDLYDPDRSRGVVIRGESGFTASDWDGFERFWRERVNLEQVAVLSEASSSESLRRLRAKLPAGSWYEYEPISRDAELRGSELALGQRVRPHYDLSNAKVIACFDSDLLSGHPASLRYARQWAAGRRSADDGEMNRLYAAESTFTCTGSVADERLPIRSGDMAAILAAVADGVGVSGLSFTVPPAAKAFVEKLVEDLNRHRGRSLVTVGPNQLPAVHALAWKINEALGNVGETLVALQEPESDAGSLSDLVDAISNGEVQTLVILGGNPVYNAPADAGFAAALGRVEHKVRLGLYVDETSMQCDWHLPQAHFLESWGDGRAWDGTLSIQQPLIRPLFDGRSAIELLSLMVGESEGSGYEIVRSTFRGLLGDSGFEQSWRRALHDGLVEGSGFAVVNDLQLNGATPKPMATGDAEGTFELTFHADAGVYDGRSANNGWLLELPGPLTKLTWGNAAWINIADARSMGIRNGDVVSIKVGSGEIQIPAYLMPGQARGSIALPLGYGRTAGSLTVGREVGVDVYPLRSSTGMGFITGAAVTATGESAELAMTTNHHLLDPVGEWGNVKRVGEKTRSGMVIKEASLDEYQRNRNFVHAGAHGDYSLQLFAPPFKTDPVHEDAPELFNEPHAWGMSVDMNACTGCSACVIACQSENNIPTVGERGVRMSREMHWLRIDRYFKNDRELDPDAEHPDVVYQPMMCVHCENAPCESVCPVAATVHDSEGLNTMVYNRCIGTRYCSNNCPYKVRRFNYFDWHSKPVRAGWAKPWLGMPDSQHRSDDQVDTIRRLGFNPDVTVRMRGVMEKCTFCTQRIARAKINAKREWQQGERDQPLVRDGEVVTACQQACPTEAIVFGDLNDPESKVSRLHRNDRTYGVLDDLNTRPRLKHMAKIRNPRT